MEAKMPDQEGMLEVVVGKRDIQAFYGSVAPVYDGATVQYEARAKALALEAMARQPGEAYLEVAVGTGISIVEQVKRTGAAGIVGIDLTPGMVALTRQRLDEAGGAAVPLLLADARYLPFQGAAFDCLFNSYMLDLIPGDDISKIVGEFGRVLRPGGHIVLANLTEGEGEDAAFMEDWKTRYLENPIQLGACRPVLAASFLRAAGFAGVQRTYCGGTGSWPTEVVTATAPGNHVHRPAHRDLMEILVCSLCKGGLARSVAREEGGRVLDGSLHCASCNETYPIANGIPNLLPPDMRA